MKDNPLLEAAAFVKRAVPTRPFYEHLLAEREISRSMLETLKGENLYVEQGKARMLTILIQLIEGAEESLDKQVDRNGS
jgi:hypothetical protein